MKSTKSDQSGFRAQRLLALALSAALALSLCLFARPADALYLMDNNDYIHVDEPGSGAVLADGSSTLLTAEESRNAMLPAGLYVTLKYQKAVQTTTSLEESVSDLLLRLNVQPSPLEMISVKLQGREAEIQVDAEFVFYEQVSQVTEHDTTYRFNKNKFDWEETIVQEGSDGEYTEVYEVVYQDGVQVSRQLIDVVDIEPVNTIIEKGTIKNFAHNDDAVASIQTNDDGTGTLTLENGAELTFKEARTMTGTAYTKNVGVVGEITASGTMVHVGVVAVDRRVIPLGTKVYVVSNDGRYTYGFAVAEDTGVLGNSIDLYMDTYNQCIQFGRRACTVYILD